MSWFWRSDSSPASFEKALSKLSAQITTTQVSLDKSRNRARRAKALWTLYTTLAYLISALIVVLVIGPQNIGLPHYSGLVLTPVVIFGGRKGITATFGWSINRQQAHLDRLQVQRDEKINDLKKATRYDSTQELLSKYGGAPSTPQSPRPEKKEQKQDKPAQPPVQRTGIPPPPTANIRGAQTINTPQLQEPAPISTPAQNPSQGQTPRSTPRLEPGFAPNAFPTPPQHATSDGPHWYDRILDVMLGEDENLAKNKIVLICSNPECRLVNGQAPPGTKSLDEVGRWRCLACGGWNGVEGMSEVKKVLGASPMPARGRGDSLAVPNTMMRGHSDSVSSTNDVADTAMTEAEGATGVKAKDEVTKRVTRSAARASSDSP